MKTVSGDAIISHLCTTNGNHVMYGFRVMKHNRQNFCHFVIFSYFLPFYPTNLKNQNFEKIEKMPGDIIILHLCTTNDNHMMYGA